MQDRLSITEQELLDVLTQAADGPPEAKTGPELCAMTGIGEKRLRRALRALNKEGRLGVHKVMRQTIDGRTVPVVAYTIRPKKRAARKQADQTVRVR